MKNLLIVSVLALLVCGSAVAADEPAPIDKKAYGEAVKKLKERQQAREAAGESLEDKVRRLERERDVLKAENARLQERSVFTAKLLTAVQSEIVKPDQSPQERLTSATTLSVLTLHLTDQLWADRSSSTVYVGQASWKSVDDETRQLMLVACVALFQLDRYEPVVVRDRTTKAIIERRQLLKRRDPSDVPAFTR